MKAFLEVFFAIHILLAVGSLCIGGRWFLQKPSLKLHLARILFASCVMSPIAIHFVKQTNRPLIAKFVSVDGIREYSQKIILDSKKSPLPSVQSLHLSKIKTGNFFQLIFILFILGVLAQVHRLISDLKKLKMVLRSAIPYKSYARLSISVSDSCLIPFAVRTFFTAHIILPISLLNSSLNMKMALAHEGQHHRQGDCLWAYFMEGIRIVFWGNPFVQRWNRILNELQELTCDEALVGHQMISAHDYGRCLFNVVQTASQSSEMSRRKFACTVGMSGNCGNVEKPFAFITRRICMLSEYQSQRPRRSILNAMLAASVILAPFCTAYAAKGLLLHPQTNEMKISSLDPNIQEIANAEIQTAVSKYHARSGAVVIADPRTGKILAFAEAQSVRGSESWKSRMFAPGSTIKPFVAAAALDAGVGSEFQVYDCRDPYYVDGQKFLNWDHNSSDVSMTDAIAQSVNVCMIKVAQNTGTEKFRKTLDDFGLNMSGQWEAKKSDSLQLAIAAMGETFSVTLESLTKAYATLANRGHAFSANSAQVVSEATADSVTRMLVAAVDHGTGTRAAIADVQVAGKTGSLAIHPNSDPKKQSHWLALFGGYAPADNPRYVAVIVIEDGRTEDEQMGYGGAVAAPVFQNVLEKSLTLSK